MASITIESRKTIGDNIRRIREASPLGVTELAEQANISRVYWYEVERGEVNVTIDNLSAIAKALKVSVRDLLTEPSKPQRKTGT